MILGEVLEIIVDLNNYFFHHSFNGNFLSKATPYYVGLFNRSYCFHFFFKGAVSYLVCFLCISLKVLAAVLA